MEGSTSSMTLREWYSSSNKALVMSDHISSLLVSSLPFPRLFVKHGLVRVEYSLLYAFEVPHSFPLDTVTRLIRPGGHLITLVFPINPAADPTVGPPYPISVDLLRSFLPEDTWEKVLDEVPKSLSKMLEGATRIAVWKKKEGVATSSL